MRQLFVISLFVLGLFLTLAPVQPAPIGAADLLESLKKTQRTANILISLHEGSPSLALSKISSNSYPTRSARLNAVASVLRAEAQIAQKSILEFLHQEKSLSSPKSVRQLWISNQIIVKDASFELVQKLATRSDISRIQEEVSVPSSVLFGSEFPSPNDRPITPRAGEQWGIVTIEAPSVWANGTTGEGVIVASIDTGVRGTHEALRDSYKNDEYSWFAPDEYSDFPTDGELHGTHTMGTILGRANGIGVAPGATWIACKWCTGSTSTCTDFDLLECGQWIACPTKPDGNDPDCSKAPHIVSNSWAWGEKPWYDDVLNAWAAGGIIPVFAAGNYGPECESVSYPGNSALVISVGATTEGNELSSFSSIGPDPNGGERRPHVAAPGSDVYSSYGDGDDRYGGMSGTSMACPHVAGLAALLLSRDPNLGFAEIKSLLEGGAVQSLTPRGKVCGGIIDTEYPNNHAGHGVVDALRSYQNLLAGNRV